MRPVVALALLAALGCRATSNVAEANRPYPCTFDAGVGTGDQCPEGWLCGLAGKCFDPAGAGSPQPCHKDAGPSEGCAGTWRCGPQSTCFDPAAAASSTVCSTDDDCVDAARCNLSAATCQPRGLGAAYRCRVDLDCESGWTCDQIGQRCVDSEGQLPTTRGDAGYTYEALSPRSTLGPPSHLAVGDSHDRVELPWLRQGFTDRVRPISYIVDGGVYLYLELGNDDRLADGGVLRNVYARRAEVDEAAVTSLAIGGGFAAWTLADGGFWALPAFDGGPAFAPQSPPLTRLAQCHSSGLTAVGPGGDAVSVKAAGQGRSFRLQQRCTQVTGPDAGTSGIECAVLQADVPVAGVPVFGCTQRMVHLDAQGRLRFGSAITSFANTVFQVEPRGRDGGNLFGGAESVQLWSAMDVPTTGTAEAAVTLVGEMLLPQGQRRAFVITAGDGLLSPVVYSDGIYFTAFAMAGGLCPGNGVPRHVLMPPPFDMRLESTRRNPPAVLALCPDATVNGNAVPAGLFSVPLAERGNDRITYERVSGSENPFAFELVTQRTGTRHRAHAASAGRVWLDDSPDEAATLEHLRPLVLDRRPLLVASFTDGFGSADIFAIAADALFSLDPQLGFISKPGRISEDVTVVGRVTGRTWVLFSNGVFDPSTSALGNDGPFQVGRLPEGARLTLPATAELGGSNLFVIGGDTVFHADMRSIIDNPIGPPVQMKTILVPAAGLRISSLAVTTLPSGKPRLALSTVSGAYIAEQADETRWQLVPIPLDGAAIKVLELAAGSLGAVLSTGEIRSLPQRGRLASALPEPLQAVDVTRSCRDTLVLATRRDQGAGTGQAGLYRLNAAGTWEPLPLPVPEVELAEARFFPSPLGLMVATDRGRVGLLKPIGDACTN